MNKSYACKTGENFSLPEYVNPMERNYLAYHCSIKTFNLLLQERVSKFLEDEIGFNGSYSFVTTGSDGRLEKGPQSKFELVILMRETPSAQDVVNATNQIVSEYNRTLFGKPEIKNLDNDTLSYYFNNPKRVYPTRMLDMKHITGRTDFVNDVRTIFFNEL